MDGFKDIHNRFDTTVFSWKGWNFLVFIVIFLKKIHKSNYFKQLQYVLNFNNHNKKYDTGFIYE